MKLRLRNFETKETLRIEVPSTCSLTLLQETLSLSLSLVSSSPSSFYFSLNTKDLLYASSPHDSLQSLGVAAGDLIYYSRNANAFSSVSHSPDPQIVTLSNSIQIPESSTNQEIPVQELPQHQEPMSKVRGVSHQTEEIEGTKSMDIYEEIEGTKSMEIDASSTGERFSEPYFLKKVLKDEVFDSNSIHKLLAIALHAVLSESGFVRFDPISGRPSDQFDLPDKWVSPISIFYSLPELLRGDDNSGPNLSDYVVLKLQTFGHFLQVYGCLVKGGSELYTLSLDASRFAPILKLMWASNFENCDKKDTAKEDDSLNSYSKDEVFRLWKNVKDGLALPLLIDLCARTYLPLPACLRRLPTDLKLKILESLPGVDIARMGCVCTEIAYLGSNNDLWKMKFEEEFGGFLGEGRRNWKRLFHEYWKTRKESQKQMQPFIRRRPRFSPPLFPYRRDPIFPLPDRVPVPDRVPFGYPAPIPMFPPHTQIHFLNFKEEGRRDFRPGCNLGGEPNAHNSAADN